MLLSQPQHQPKTTDLSLTPVRFDTNFCLHIIRVYMTQDGQSKANHFFYILDDYTMVRSAEAKILGQSMANI